MLSKQNKTKQQQKQKEQKKRHNFACDNYIFPKTRGNKNKLSLGQAVDYYSALKGVLHLLPQN